MTHHRGPQELAGELHQDDLESDQHEQHGIQNCIDQLPEHVQVSARGVGHCKRTPMIADDEADDDHCERTGYMQMARERVSSHHSGECDQDFFFIAVDAAQEPVRTESHSGTEQ
jgi:hypothetical protein